jgi:hypothetical protein
MQANKITIFVTKETNAQTWIPGKPGSNFIRLNPLTCSELTSWSANNLESKIRIFTDYVQLLEVRTDNSLGLMLSSYLVNARMLL